MIVITEPMPPQKSSPRGVVRYAPECGVIEIETRRSTDRYAIRTIPSEIGAAFYLTKLTPGTDRTETGYSVLLGRGGEPNRCECRGAASVGVCKHIHAVNVLDKFVRSAFRAASTGGGER